MLIHDKKCLIIIQSQQVGSVNVDKHLQHYTHDYCKLSITLTTNIRKYQS
jgi:hypothetical protein